MTWVFLILGTAFFQAVKDVHLKRAMGAAHPVAAVWFFCLVSAALFGASLVFTGIPEIGPGFWPALAGAGACGVVSLLLYLRALYASDLSHTLPMLTFTPIFMLLTSPLMLGEFPDRGGLLGIVLIVAGSYLLNIGAAKEGILAPFKALLREPGPRIMLVVALIWSLAGNFDKMGINGSAPLFWVACLYAVIALVLTVPAMRLLGRGESKMPWKSADLIFAGSYEALSIGLQMFALMQTIVPYAIAVKRLSVVIGVLLGALVFKEKGLASRLAGSILMVLGVLFIAFFG